MVKWKLQKKLASRDLLVKVINSKQVNDLLKLRYIHCYKVEAKIPTARNARFKTRFMDEERKTTTVVLNFGKTTLPEIVEIGYAIFNVRPFIANPLRCSKCQMYGHSNQACKLLILCAAGVLRLVIMMNRVHLWLCVADTAKLLTPLPRGTVPSERRGRRSAWLNQRRTSTSMQGRR